MKVFLLLTVLLLSALCCSATPQRTYKNCKWFKGSPTNYKFYWSYNATHINAAMEAHTRGWIGLGISTDGSMTSDFKRSDIIVGWVNSTGHGYVKDYSVDVHSVPSLDPMHSQDVRLTASQKTAAGVTTIEFSRLLSTGQQDDRDFLVDGKFMYLIWATGDDIPSNDGQAFNQHTKKGAVFLNLTAASVCPSSPPLDTDMPVSHTWTSETTDYTLKWSIVDQSWLDVTVSGKTGGWVGLGFSDTNSMFYADMIVGWVNDDDLSTRVYDMYCGDKRIMPEFDEHLGGRNDVQTLSGSQTEAPNGEKTTTLRYRRPLITSDSFDLDIVDRDIYVLYALGTRDGNADGAFREHDQKGIVRINLKTGSFNSTVEAWIEDPRTTLRSSHGSLMVLGWILFMTIGRFVAAYGRKMPNWWQIHVACQALGMLCISLSLAVILKAVGTQGKHFGTAHGIFGIILVVAAFVQTALGAMAHFLRTTESPFFPNGIHQYLGHIIWWAAIYNIPLGLRQYQIAPFTKEGNGFWAVWVVWLLLMVGVTVFIFYSKWREHHQRQEDKAKARAQGEQDPYDIYTTSHYDPSLINQLERVDKGAPSFLEVVTGNKILTASFVIHIGLAITLALLFTSLANTKPVPPFHYCPNCTETTLKFDNFAVLPGAHPQAAVPTSHAVFCKGFDLGASDSMPFHIVEINPSVTTAYPTHMRLFAVPYDATQWASHFPCLEALDGAVPIYGWSVGMGPFVLPAEAGLLAGPETTIRHVVLQIHYENPQLLPNIVDNSGIVIKRTTTLRPHNAGIMAIGVAPSSISLAPQTEEVEIAGFCSSDKTSTLTIPIKVFSVSQTTRKYGKLAWLEQWTPSGISHAVTFSNLIGQSHAQSLYEPLVMASPTEATIKPGDLLVTHCIYDTRTSNATILGGDGYFEELCWSWISYYPKSDAIKCYSSATPYSPNDGHFRPDRNSSLIL
jgi:hypothetical protein